MQFEATTSKVKMFSLTKRNDDLNPIDAANKLFEEMEIDCPTTDDSSMQVEHAESSLEKSAGLEVHFS